MSFMVKLTDSIEVLKTSSLVNDLHQEAYQPLQMAAVAYEVCKILVPANKAEKYKASFVKKVVNPLEKNVVNVVNPAVDREDCQYKKLEYNLCSSLTRFRVDEGKTPDGTPKKTTR
jgi:hypothetical protein